MREIRLPCGVIEIVGDKADLANSKLEGMSKQISLDCCEGLRRCQYAKRGTFTMVDRRPLKKLVVLLCRVIELGFKS